MKKVTDIRKETNLKNERKAIIRRLANLNMKELAREVALNERYQHEAEDPSIAEAHREHVRIASAIGSYLFDEVRFELAVNKHHGDK